MGKSVITIAGKRKIILARKGEKPLPKIKGMAIGDGASSENGILQPTEYDNKLKNELIRKEIESSELVSDTCCRYKCSLKKEELAGKKISELALYDEEDDLIAIRTFAPKEKDDDMEMVFEVDDQF